MGIVDSFVDGVKGFFGFGSGSQRTSSTVTPRPQDHSINEHHPIHDEGKKSKGFFSSAIGGGGTGTLLLAFFAFALMTINPLAGGLTLAGIFAGPLKGIGSLFGGNEGSNDQPSVSGGESTRTPSLTTHQRTTENSVAPARKPAPLPSDGWVESVKETGADWFHRATENVGVGPSTNRNVLRWVAPLDLNGKEKAHHLPTGFLAAIMDQESRGIPGQVSSAKCEGLFQFKKETADGLCIDRNHPEQAAEGAARMMEQLSKKYNGNLDAMMAGYNWGQGNYDKWVKRGSNPNEMPKETRDYIARVKSLLPQYAEATVAIAGGVPAPVVVAASPPPKHETPAPSKPQLAALTAGVKNTGVTDGKDAHSPTTASHSTAVAATKPGYITL